MNVFPPVFAQNDGATSATAQPSATPAQLPHGKFLWDYLLVAALLAGALYAVCRSSRRL